MPSTISAGTTTGTAVAIAGDTTGNLAFQTNGTTTAMTIDTSQNVLIGTNSAATSSTLNVVGTGYQPIYVNTTISGGGGAAFSRSGTQAMYIGTAGSSWLTGSSTADGLMRSEANMLFATGNTERMRIPTAGGVQSAGSISVGGATPTTSGAGITFPATQSASSDANTLDDYEEGSFTPTIAGSSTSGTYVYDTTNTFGRYQKVGLRVNFDLCVGISSVTSAGSGNLLILGMPFTPQGFTNYYASCSVGYFVFITTGWTGYYISCLSTVGSASLQIYYSGNSSSVALPVTTLGAGSYLYISGSYLT